MTHLKDVAKASFSKEISKDKQDWTVSVVGNFVETQFVETSEGRSYVRVFVSGGVVSVVEGRIIKIYC